IHGKRTPRSVSQHIFNFEDATHSGLYECFARTSSGEEHSRKMRVSTKAVLPRDFVPCPNGDDYCGANGRCGMKNEDKICVCDPGYVGQQCEHLLVKDYLSDSISVTTAKVVAGAGGTLNVALIFLTVLFATLFIKERKRLRLLRSQQLHSVEELTFFVKPQNPYNEPDSISREKVHLQRSYAFDQSIHRTTRPSAFRRFRIAIRDRLSTKPSGISAETPPVT
ncbi:EGF domain-containing protein, partial [Trichostrongylus colubriformis]